MIRGEHVRARRQALGMNQIELATAVGISQAMVSQIEMGRRDVALPLVASLAAVLQTTVEVLSGTSDEDDASAPGPADG